MKSKTYTDKRASRESELDLAKLFHNILSKLWVIILVGVIGALAAYFYTSENITPTYSSTARVYIQNRQGSSQSSQSDLASAAILKEDFKIYVKSEKIYRGALVSLGEDGANYKSLGGKVTLDNNETRFVDITVSDPDPIRAKMLVDAIANTARVSAKKDLGVEDIAIIELGTVPTSPSSPNMQTNIILGAGVGMVAVIAVITLLTMFNNKISTAEDIENYLGIAVLGSIPNAKSIPVYEKIPGKQKPSFNAFKLKKEPKSGKGGKTK